MKNEPAITIGGVSAAVVAIMALAVAFGLPLDDAQQKAILGVVAAVGPLIAAVITRAYVSPASKNTHRAD